MDRGQGRMSLLKVVQNIQSLCPTFISLQVIMFLSTVVSGMPSSTEVTVLSTKGNDYYNNNRYSSWCGFYMELCLHKLQSMSMKQAMLSLSVASDSLRHHVLQPTRLLCPWDSPGKNTGMGCHALLQGIFPIQGSNLGLLHCRWILYHLSNQDSPGEGQDEEGRLNYDQHTERKRGLQVLVIWPRSCNQRVGQSLNPDLCPFTES